MTTPPPTPVPSVSMHEARGRRGPRRAGTRRSAAALASFSMPDRQLEPPLAARERNVELVDRDVDGAERDAGLLVDARGDAEADRRDLVRAAAPGRRSASSSSSAPGTSSRRALDGLVDAPVGVDDPGEDLGPAEVDADDALVRSYPVGNLTRRMAREEKPYRVYRGGRAKGKVPTPASARRASSAAASSAAAGRRRRAGRLPRPGAPTGQRNGRAGGAGSRSACSCCSSSSSSGRSRAGSRSRAASRTRTSALDQNAKLALAPQSGLLLSHPTTILMLGTDNAQIGGRAGDRHSDSIMLAAHRPVAPPPLLPLDPARHRGADPGRRHAEDQRRVPDRRPGARDPDDPRSSPASTINHVMVVNFADFKDLIDALGGIDVNVPKPIRSNRFDCPYATQARCDAWQGWRFQKGTQHMSGQRALIYSRIRENMLDPSETDVTRGARQQDVMNAVAQKFTSLGDARGCRSPAARS